MRESFFRWAMHLLRIPPDPRVPAGEGSAEADGTAIRVFRAAPNLYRYNMVRWGGTQFLALLGLIAGAFFVRVFSASLGTFLTIDLVVWIEAFAWLTFVGQLPFSYAMVRLDYELRWYIVTDRSLRIREGLVRIREQTMTFANIQNMSIRQDPLQRVLGIADVEVHTAGGGKAEEGWDGAGRPVHVGVFRGVADAQEIRDAIGERVRRHRGAGLGDLEDEAGEDGGEEEVAVRVPLLDAARELLEETRRLGPELRRRKRVSG